MLIHDTASGVVVNSTKVMGVAIIATKIDIPTAIFFLFFFSFIHALIVLHQSKNDGDDNYLSIIDFVTLMIIANGSGLMFILFGILSGRDELTIYMFGIIGSLLGIKGINTFLDFFLKKIGFKENNIKK